MMFAVIKTGGKQYRVQEGDILDVEKLPGSPSQRLHFSQVLLIADEKDTLIGRPFVERALVQAEILENFKDEKIIVFKKKRRKQFRRTRGHRQPLTRVKIEKIIPDVTALAPEEIAAIERKPVEKVAPAEGRVEVPAKRKKARPAKRPAVAAPAQPKKTKPAAKAKKPSPAKITKEKKKG